MNLISELNSSASYSPEREKAISKALKLDMLNRRNHNANERVEVRSDESIESYGLDSLFEKSVSDAQLNSDEIIAIMSMHVTRLLDGSKSVGSVTINSVVPIMDYELDKKYHMLMNMDLADTQIVSQISKYIRQQISRVHAHWRNEIDVLIENKNCVVKWDERDLNKHKTPPDFIKDIYQPYIGKGLILADIQHIDGKLYRALYNWLRSENNSLPNELLSLQSRKAAA